MAEPITFTRTMVDYGVMEVRVHVDLHALGLSADAAGHAIEQALLHATSSKLLIINEMGRAYLAGDTLAEIGARHGVHSDTVRRWLREAGVTMRGRGPVRGATRKAATGPLAAPEVKRLRQMVAAPETPDLMAALKASLDDARARREHNTTQEEASQQ